MNEKQDVVLHCYSRSQALEDGVLVDVSEMAKIFGFTVPVAMTVAAWHHCVAAKNKAEETTETYRLGSLLDVFYHVFTSNGPRVPASFEFKLVSLTGTYVPEVRPFELKAHFGNDDVGARCITLMLPGED